MSDEPVARIRQIGRWRYIVTINQGTMVYGANLGLGWEVWGRKRAEAKGRRELARYRLREARTAAAWDVTSPD